MQVDTFTATVAEVRREAVDVVSVLLEARGRSDIATSPPGSHVDVHASGRMASFSLCSRPEDGARFRIAVQLGGRPGGVSSAVHALRPGDVAELSGPRNHFALGDDAQPAILIAGGIGITPILSMAYSLSAAGQDFDLRYCARSRAHAAFAAEMEDSCFAGKLRFHFTASPSAGRFDARKDLLGYSRARPIFVCGPARLIDDVATTARTLGWRDDRIHFERFHAAKVHTAEENVPFEVVLARTGLRIQVLAGSSIVDALRAEGIFVPVSCGQGVCGTCTTRVLDGVPDHRDSCLLPEDRLLGGLITPCCSRALSPTLVLDL